MDEIKTRNTTTSNTYQVNLGGQHSVTGTYGWICPICGRGVAPDQEYCNCRPVVYPTPINPWYPTWYPTWWYQVTCNTTGNPPNTATSYTTTSTSTKAEV